MTTPVSREAAGGAAIPPDTLSLGARLLGMVRRPSRTFQAVAARPAWLGILLTTTLAAMVVGALVAATDIGRVGLVDQWERTAFAFGYLTTDADYSRLQAWGRFAPLYAAGTAIAAGPIAAFGAALLAHVLLARPGSRATLTQAVAVSAHAGVILALRQLIAPPLSYLRETTANGTALSAWFPVADQSSMLGRALGVVDVFVLWWVVMLAIGFGVIYQRRTRTIALGLISGYAAVAGLLALAMAGAARP